MPGEMAMRSKEYERGARDAAGVAAQYNRTTTHEHRLDDCILAKLNIGKRRKPRRNVNKLEKTGAAWLRGFAMALAEMHRQRQVGAESLPVRVAANGVGLSLEVAKRVKLNPYDLKELKRAGIK